jgi:guanine deaminase
VTQEGGEESVSGQLSGHILTPIPGGETAFYPDSKVVWDEQGRIQKVEEGEGSKYLIIPGLVDAHVHLPQYRVRGLFQDALLPWLRQHIWPEEERFEDKVYASQVTEEFRRALVDVGTTSAMVYGAPGANSAEFLLEGLQPLCIKGGDVLMDRNGPAELLRSASESLADIHRAAQRWGGRYVLTPRFVPTCSSELMDGCGAIAVSMGLSVQTHLAENIDEVDWVRELHPEHRSYAATYDAFGLLGPRSVLGHCIHLDNEDLELLRARGSFVAHCPTSNEALGSGRMPLERLQAAGIPIALATDVGAGPDLSLLDVIRCCLEVHSGIVDVSPGDALRMATLSGACALGEGGQRGAIKPGYAADLVALQVPEGMRKGESGEDAFFRVLQEFEGRYEDAVVGVWIAGERVKSL